MWRIGVLEDKNTCLSGKAIYYTAVTIIILNTHSIANILG